MTTTLLFLETRKINFYVVIKSSKKKKKKKKKKSGVQQCIREVKRVTQASHCSE